MYISGNLWNLLCAAEVRQRITRDIIAVVLKPMIIPELKLNYIAKSSIQGKLLADFKIDLEDAKYDYWIKIEMD